MIKYVEKSLSEGKIISESSHYIVKSIAGSTAKLIHFESGEEIQIGLSYLANYTHSGDNFEQVVKVTKEDKRDGTPGIRTIWESIHSGQVFTVCFKKQDTVKSQKRINYEIEAISQNFCDDIDKIQKSKKGVADAAKKFVEELIKNPILPYVEGEERVLRGYKVQFESRDGRYNCVDMDIVRSDKESGLRPVNINTIKYLIYDNIKYVVE